MANEGVVYLSKMKRLIKEGNCRFEPRDYGGYSYLEILFNDFGITIEVAWRHILGLNIHFLVTDAKPEYEKEVDTYVFKKPINGSDAYIKVKLENENVVVISFHKDY